MCVGNEKIKEYQRRNKSGRLRSGLGKEVIYTFQVNHSFGVVLSL
jgi:hypothetical protein